MWFLTTLALLIVFAVISQIACDKIALESRRGPYWDYHRGFPYLGITIGATCAVTGAVWLVVRFFPVKYKVSKILAWLLGIAMVAWMLFVSGFYIYYSLDFEDVYHAGWWIGYVNKLEEEQALWRKSRWFGRGDEYYQYDYDIFANAPTEEYRAKEEPYHTAVEERYKAETVYQYFNSDTMLNVLSYFYGRWVWLLYLLIAFASAALAISMLPLLGNAYTKTLYCVACFLFTVITIMPALNGCGLVYDGVHGPPFTGYGYGYWGFGISITGPTLGIMLGLSSYEQDESTKKSNVDKMMPITAQNSTEAETANENTQHDLD